MRKQTTAAKSHPLPTLDETSATPGKDPRDQLGPVLRHLRRASKMTLQELSERTGLASSTLSKIENNLISPTYDSILKLADGLKIDVAQLFDPASIQMSLGRRSVTRDGKGAMYKTDQYDYEMLCTDLSQKKFFPIVATIKAHSVADFPELPRHAGEEFIYVLSGEVEVHTEHYEPVRMVPGDCVYFDSSMGHACVSAGKKSARILWVTSESGLVERRAR
jgi:transcriptional regulator with XRE-family HTH domain